jgi:hypothetical protein
MVAEQFKNSDQLAIQVTGAAKHFVHTGIRRFFLRDFAHWTDLIETGMDVTLFAFTIPK